MALRKAEVFAGDNTKIKIGKSALKELRALSKIYLSSDYPTALSRKYLSQYEFLIFQKIINYSLYFVGEGSLVEYLDNSIKIKFDRIVYFRDKIVGLVSPHHNWILENYNERDEAYRFAFENVSITPDFSDLNHYLKKKNLNSIYINGIDHSIPFKYFLSRSSVFTLREKDVFNTNDFNIIITLAHQLRIFNKEILDKYEGEFMFVHNLLLRSHLYNRLKPPSANWLSKYDSFVFDTLHSVVFFEKIEEKIQNGKISECSKELMSREMNALKGFGTFIHDESLSQFGEEISKLIRKVSDNKCSKLEIGEDLIIKTKNTLFGYPENIKLNDVSLMFHYLNGAFNKSLGCKHEKKNYTDTYQYFLDKKKNNLKLDNYHVIRDFLKSINVEKCREFDGFVIKLKKHLDKIFLSEDSGNLSYFENSVLNDLKLLTTYKVGLVLHHRKEYEKSIEELEGVLNFDYSDSHLPESSPFLKGDSKEIFYLSYFLAKGYYLTRQFEKAETTASKGLIRTWREDWIKELNDIRLDSELSMKAKNKIKEEIALSRFIIAKKQSMTPSQEARYIYSFHNVLVNDKRDVGNYFKPILTKIKYEKNEEEQRIVIAIAKILRHLYGDTDILHFEDRLLNIGNTYSTNENVIFYEKLEILYDVILNKGSLVEFNNYDKKSLENLVYDLYFQKRWNELNLIIEHMILYNKENKYEKEEFDMHLLWFTIQNTLHGIDNIKPNKALSIISRMSYLAKEINEKTPNMNYAYDQILVMKNLFERQIEHEFVLEKYNLGINGKNIKLENQKKILKDTIVELEKLRDSLNKNIDKLEEKEKELTKSNFISNIFLIILLIISVFLLQVLLSLRKSKISLENEKKISESQNLKLSEQNKVLEEQKNILFFQKEKLQNLNIIIEKQKSEMYHRVNGNLENLIGVLEIQKNGLDSSSAKKSLVDTVVIVENYLKIHELLHEQSDKEDGVMLSASGFLEKLSDYINETFYTKSVQIKSDISDGIKLKTKHLAPLGMALYELMTNSLKHAFKDTNMPKIEFLLENKGENDFVFRYSDNGIGVPKEYFQGKEGRMGMRIINFQFKEALDGTIEVESSVNGGFIYEAKF